MAESIKARIAALNLEQVAVTPNAPPPYSYDHAAAKKARPPPPPPPANRPAYAARQHSTNVPPLRDNAPTTTTTDAIGNLPAPAVRSPTVSKPALPPRLPPRHAATAKPPVPALPPRRPSEQSVQRRPSTESVSTIASSHSSISGVSTRTSFSARSGNLAGDGSSSRALPPPFDPSKLPPLPPKRQTEEAKPARAALKPTHSAPAVVRKTSIEPPPPLPNRPPLPARQSTTPAKPQPPKNNVPKRSALEFALNKSTETPPVPGPRPGQAPQPDAVPPPIPLASRPNLAQLNASKPQPTDPGSCLKCRDFRAVDAHAARFPRQSHPNLDVPWLAHQLTSPFPSATDKARAIFTWLHHNIDYDVDAFFNNAVKPSTPASTLARGLAVCEGYAGLFAALALHAGLEAVVVGGHGKGFGYAALAPGAAIPPFRPNHAWNAVRIDGGAWKLIDPCWGSGNCNGPGQPYRRDFTPSWFTMDNEEFGERHFPSESRHWYRTDDGNKPMLSWEEYLLLDAGGRVQVFGAAEKRHGLAPSSFLPREKGIRVHADEGTVRLQFGKICPHWDFTRHGEGAPYLFAVALKGADGRRDWLEPFQMDVKGGVWWVDVPRVEMGMPGATVTVFALTSFDGGDGRGLTVERFRERYGRCGWAGEGVAAWGLV